MKKSNIKIHLIDEQTGRNGAMVHVQTGSDSVRRMMGSGSGDGGSGSGDGGGSGNTETSKTVSGYKLVPLFVNFDLSFSMERVSWIGSIMFSVTTNIIEKDSHKYSIIILSGGLSGGLTPTIQSYFEGEDEIIEEGNQIAFSDNLYPTNIGSDVNTNPIENDTCLTFNLRHVKKTYSPTRPEPHMEWQDKTITLQIHYKISAYSANGVVLSVQLD